MLELAYTWLEANNLEPLAYPDHYRYMVGLIHDAHHALLGLGITNVEEVYVTLFQLGCLGWSWHDVNPNNPEANHAYGYWLAGTTAPDWLKAFNATYSVLHIL